ncbi:hypothetical protein [Ponticaulis profundi]|uniref:Uncharacterized protein n=1 Tax=Ponticaulis profundi TaxID=2665222 RepID=A0ABW1S7S9_9PROT
MYKTERSDAYASAELGNSGLKERVATIAKAGFLVATGILAIQIFMKLVFVANL